MNDSEGEAAGKDVPDGKSSGSPSKLKALFNKLVVEPLKGYTWFFGWPLSAALFKPPNVLAGFALWGAIHLATTGLAADDQDYAREQGLDETAVATLSNNRTALFDRDLRGRFALENRLPPNILVNGVGYFKSGERGNATANAALSVTTFGLMPCVIAKLHADVTVKDFLGFVVRPEHQKPVPVSATQIHKYVNLHEVRHCASDNFGLSPIYKEADSDWRAIQAIAATEDVTALTDFVLHHRAMYRGDTGHDTALYLYHEIHNLPQPSEEEMRAATALLRQPLRYYGADMFHSSHMIDKAVRLTLLLNDPAPPVQLSDLARTRAQLYIDAVKMFRIGSEAIDEILAAQPQQTPSAQNRQNRTSRAPQIS